MSTAKSNPEMTDASIARILAEFRESYRNLINDGEAFRLMQDTPTPTEAVTATPTMAPTAPSNSDGDDEGLGTFHQLFLVVVFVTGGFCIWYGCSVWKKRREQYNMQMTSARADSVLGDMQMVPNDEYEDDDPELL